MIPMADESRLEHMPSLEEMEGTMMHGER